MKSNLTVGFLTATDPRDKKSWSGIHYRMYKALMEEFDHVVPLGPLQLTMLQKVWLWLRLTITSLLHKLVYFKRFNKYHNHFRSKLYGRYFDEQLNKLKLDVIFAPTASVEIAHLTTKTPICYFSDTSFEQFSNYYQSFTKFSKSSKREGNEIEQLAIKKAAAQVYPSNWALEFSKSYYMASNPQLVKMGANIDEVTNDQVLKKSFDSTLELLFIGVDWARKGGDLVQEILELISNENLDIHLTVIGCTPPFSHKQMTVIPYLDKNIPSEMARFNKILSTAHLFLMPTRAECYGIVFCEANAFGLPVITTATGGTTAIVENGTNGYALPLDAEAEEYFKILERLNTDRSILKELSIKSFEKYKAELNWGVWAQNIRIILTSITNRNVS